MMTPIQMISELQQPDHMGKELKDELIHTVQKLNRVLIDSQKLVKNQCYAQDIASRCPKQACPLYAVCLAVAAFDE